MASLVTAAVLLILSRSANHVLAHPSASSASTSRICADIIIPVTVANATNSVFQVPHVNNDIDAVTLALDIDRWSAPNITQRTIRNFDIVNETFDISAQLCTPKVKVGDKAQTLQIATHGFHFDKRYWDSTMSPSANSYVSSALDAGYSILTYDRLGTGLSSKPDAYTHLQGPLELEILRGLSELALSGTLLTHAKFCNTPSGVASALYNLKYSRLVHVGHSFGSILTSALAATYPSLTSTIVITGWLPSIHAGDVTQADFGLIYAGRPGYLKQGTLSATQEIFFHIPFSSNLLSYAKEIQAPVGATETLSVQGLVQRSGAGFRGAVLYLLAEWDAAVCGGDCKGLYPAPLLEGLWPAATRREAYLVKGAGHGLVLHPSALEGFEVMRNFIEG